MNRFLENAKRMIEIRSVSADGSERITSFTGALMERFGLKVQTQQVSHSYDWMSKRQFNVIGTLGDPLVDRTTRRGLLFVSHLDTVAPEVITGTHEKCDVSESKVKGLGAVDGKLDFLAKLFAMIKFREAKLRKPVYLAGTCGEESGMFGVRYLLESMVVNPETVLVGKPTSLRLLKANKGSGVYRVSLAYQVVERGARGFNRRINLRFRTSPKHSALYPEDRNAIQCMFALLRRAHESGFELKYTKLGGGECTNQLPCAASVEMYLTSHQFEDFKRFLSDYLESQGLTDSVEFEMGGLGDRGIRFLPDRLFECLIEIHDQVFEYRENLKSSKEAGYSYPHSSVCFTQMEQSDSKTDLLCDFRLLPNQTREQFEQAFSERLSPIVKNFPEFNLRSKTERYNPPFEVDSDHEWIQECKKAAKDCGLKTDLAKSALGSEAGHFSDRKFPVAVFGPGDPELAHGPEEEVVFEQLASAQKFYEAMIERVCL